MRTRRSFLGLGAGAIVAAALPLPAFAAAETWIVSYLWSRTLTRVVDHRKVVADVLGAEIAATLSVVRGTATSLWGLVDSAPGADRAAIGEIAAARDRALRAALGGKDVLATAMPDQDYARTFHVAYGVLADQQEARARQDLVARMLGPDVRSALTLEGAEGGWQPVYQRFGEAASTEAVAARHAKILAARKIPASAVADRYFDARWALTGPLAQVPPGDKPPPPVLEPEPPVAIQAEPPVLEPEPPVLEPEPPLLEPEPVVVADKAKLAEPPPAVDTLDLPATSDTPLRDAINRHIQDLRKQGLIQPDETTSWYVQTLHDDRTWAAINAERSLQCASMFKPFVALAFLHRVEEGRIVYGSNSRTKLEAMIQYSSNTATNWAMETLGGPESVQRILTQNYGRLLRETSITEYIPRSGRTYKNRSSARDYVRFSRALWRNELPRAAELKRLMTLPGNDRLYTGAPAIPKCTEVMNKTGTTAQLCGDFGILVAQTRSGKKVPYAIVGIIEKSCAVQGYSSWVAARTGVIRSVSNLAYTALKEHYALV